MKITETVTVFSHITLKSYNCILIVEFGRLLSATVITPKPTESRLYLFTIVVIIII